MRGFFLSISAKNSIFVEIKRKKVMGKKFSFKFNNTVVENTEPFVFDVEFYRKARNGFVYWYADIPNHTEDENEMVCGSDSFLETLADGKERIKVKFCLKEPNNFIAHFTRGKHDDEGAWYTGDDGVEIWICNVTHDVVGEHPVDLYITSVE